MNTQQNIRQKLSSEGISNKLHELTYTIEQCQNDTDLNACMHTIGQVFDDVCSDLKRKVNTNKQSQPHIHSNETWFNDDCADRRVVFYRKLNKYRHDQK